MSHRDREVVRKEAEASQARFKQSKKVHSDSDLDKPLSSIDGIPIAIKDNILVEGM